jgi:hypothetical protein
MAWLKLRSSDELKANSNPAIIGNFVLPVLNNIVLEQVDEVIKITPGLWFEDGGIPLENNHG